MSPTSLGRRLAVGSVLLVLMVAAASPGHGPDAREHDPDARLGGVLSPPLIGDLGGAPRSDQCVAKGLGEQFTLRRTAPPRVVRRQSCYQVRGSCIAEGTGRGIGRTTGIS